MRVKKNFFIGIKRPKLNFEMNLFELETAAYNSNCN